MNADLFLAVDASTTASKAFVFDTTGHIVTMGRGPITLHNPGPDAYEQDALEWWQSTRQALREAVANLTAEQVASLRGLSIVHQRETIVLTDEQGEPLQRALCWMDARCRAEVDRATRTLGSVRLHALSGKPACTTPSLYKLMYLLEQSPELRERAYVADVHAFLAQRLIGRAVTSLASADPTGLVDMRGRGWGEPLLKLLGISVRQLPTLVEPGALMGALLDEVADDLRVPRGLPVFAGAGDGQAACLGSGINEPGRAYLNLGTAVVSGVVTRSYQVDLAFRTLFSATGRDFCLETDLKGGTFTLNWLERFLGRRPDEGTLQTLEGQALSLPPGSDGLVVLPYWCGVMNPYWDDDASGVLFGLHGDHDAAHVYRAILEGIALEQRMHLEGVLAATGEPLSELIVMGGGSRSDLWCQILADVLGRPVVRSENIEATALGGAMLVAVGCGTFADVTEAATAMTRKGPRFAPGPSRAFYDRLYKDVYRGLFSAVESRMSLLAGLRRTGGFIRVTEPPEPPTKSGAAAKIPPRDESRDD